MKKHVVIIVIALALVVVLGLYAVTFTVRWQEQALVLHFGRIDRLINAEGNEAGLHWRLPYPVETAVRFDTRIRTLIRPATETRTRDQQNIIVTLYMNWRISDARQFYSAFHKAGYQEADVVMEAEKTLLNFMGEAGNVFTEYEFNQLVTLDPDRFKLADLEQDAPGGMLRKIKDLVASKKEGEGFGVEIINVGIKKLGVPDSVTEKVFARMASERQKEITKLLQEGESQKNTIISEAQSQATMIKATATAEARDIRGQGDAEAAQFYADLLKQPQLAGFLRKLETLKATLNDRTTIVIDSRTAPFKMLLDGPDFNEIADTMPMPAVSTDK